MRNGLICLFLLCVAAFLWLALDGALHWDEPSYLYTGAYLDFDQVLAGEFQPSGIHNFYLTRPLYILLVHGVFALTGPGLLGLCVLIGVFTSSLLGFLAVTRLILRELWPGATALNTAMVLGLLIPVVPYLAFKTLPENVALLCSAVVMLVLLKAARATQARPAFAWFALAVLGVAMALWFKGPMLLLPASGVAAVAIAGGPTVRRARLVGCTLLAAGLGLGLAYAGVVAIGIDPSIYARGISRVGAEHEPITARLLNNGVEMGVFILALPLALLSAHRRLFAVFACWFLLATAPLALLFPSMEARYQSPNIPALIGLTALALDGMRPWVAGWWRGHRVKVAAGVLVALMGIVISDSLAIAVMQHEVRMGQMHRLLQALDAKYGQDGYAVLTAWAYTDYMYLRVAYPDRAIYSAYSVETLIEPHLSPDLIRRSQEGFYPDRLVLESGQWDRLGGKTPVLLGFHESFAIENLRTIFSHLPGDLANRALKSIQLNDHLATSWLWTDPGYERVEVAAVGHYLAYEVRPTVKPGGAVAAGPP